MTSPDAQARLKAEQSAWLVECPKYHPGEYFALCECGCGRHHWTKNVHNATKFATKEEAETARGGDTNCIAVDHLFGLTLPTRTPDAQPSSTEGEVELVAKAIAAAEWSRDARLRHLEHEVGDTAERYAERSWGLWTDHAVAAIAAQVTKS